jgi:hypothetical protein
MKMKIVSVLCVGILGISLETPAVASPQPDAAFFDAVLGRPVGLAATVVGSALFVVSLPFSATSGSIKPTADSLVGKPARFTFTRPLGDFDYSYQSPYDKYAGQQKPKRVTAKKNQEKGRSGSL